MKYRKRKAAAALALLLITTVAAIGYIADRRRRVVTDPGKMPVASQPASPAQGRGTSGKGRQRNLSLQPEALVVARSLGTRFGHGNRAQSTVVGNLTIGTETRMVRTVRTQTDDGEQIEIDTAGRGGVLTWDSKSGALSGTARAHGPDRELIERLVFDSPDQFVLAQLRGASYFTVARNVRSADAGENYRGPLWNIVRVSDPEKDESKAAQSRWRLYYIDAATGLIDRIESEVNGRRIIAEFSGWTEQNGQKVPTAITWKQDGQTVMQYRITSFGHVER
jgi:hypothetical protein